MAHLDGESYLSFDTSGYQGPGAELAAFDEAAFIQVGRRRFDECCYPNAGTCPDCTGAMIRLGTCFSCPSCGYQSCGG